MATYVLQGPPHAGATLTFQTPSGVTGDLAPTGQGIGLLVLNNSTAAAITVQLPISQLTDNLPVGGTLPAGGFGRTVTLPPSGGGLPGIELIPLPSSVYGTAPTSVEYSTTASVSVAVITVP